VSDRKKLITEAGGIYRNYRSGYSFENPVKREIYFGAWEHLTDASGIQTIFGLNWNYENGKKKNGFDQAERCIKLIVNEKYKLFTFSMKAKEPQGQGPDRIGSVGVLTQKKLVLRDFTYFAYPASSSEPSEDLVPAIYMEGAKRVFEQTAYERCPRARKACLDHFKFSCRVCDFNFEKTYGKLGSGYIHVHHLELVSRRDGSSSTNPIKDLRPVCPNCHAMIHKKRKPYSINTVRRMIAKEPWEPDE